ncbi:MAG: translocation/assembly module TamB domain-containing protein, partial [Gammaproteobacteria bacterium]
ALHVRALDLRLLRGQAGLRGDVQFAPTLCASGAFNARGLDVAALAPALESALALRGEAQACREGDAWRAQLALAALEGQWRGQRVRGAGRYLLDAAGQRIEGLALRVGGNRLALDARLAGSALAGEFTVSAPRLAELAPELRGRLEASGTLGGSLAEPRVAAALHGAGLAFGAWRATALEGSADLDLGRARPSTLSVSLAELAQGARRLGDLGLAISGDARAQRIDLTLQGGAPRLALALEGAWRAPGWAGRVVSARVGEPRVGDWRLVAPAALRWQPDAFSLERACLAQRRGRACLAVPRWGSAEAAVALDVDALPLTLLGPWLPTTLTPRGTLGLHATLERTGLDAGWRGQGEARVTRGGLRYRAPGEPVRDLPLSRAALAFSLDDTRFDARLDAALADWLALDGTLEAGLEPDAPWRGRFTLDLPDIAWVEGFVPELAGSSGAARLALALRGTRAAPELEGELTASSATLRVPRTGTAIEQLALDFRGWPARGLALHGGAKLGAGQLALSGDVRWPDAGGPIADLRLSGENLALLRLPDVEADASPTLTLAVTSASVALDGTVLWPRVQVSLRELPAQAVATSSDEVIVGTAAAQTAAAAPRNDWFTDSLSADLDLVLGDDVALSAAGLEAKVAGAVHWTKPRHDDRGRGSGRLTVKSGSYKAYGQSLSIKSGALLFAGAIDNPALDVRAVRPDIDTTAGVHVTGNLRAPRFQLFAEPSLPDAEVLSYLVTGHALGEASSGEAGLIARAALGLGTERAAVIAGQLSGLFALDELGINAGTTARTSSIVAGKRLTPKLTVRSEFNPFERLWTFFVNYKLSPRWSVEAQTGAGQGADLIYSVERDSFSGSTTPAPAPR